MAKLSKDLPWIIPFMLLASFTNSQEHCDPSYCNFEGQCIEENNLRKCQCIGENYFTGARCAQIVDSCRSRPCQNQGQCHGLVGQYMCRQCTEGYGGLWCDVKRKSIFQNMALYFNHYGYYAKSQNFLIVVENLGSVDFSLELLGHNYVVDSFETKMGRGSTQWTHTSDLASVIRKCGIRYYNDLPYGEGYYHRSQQVFWDLGMLILSLRSYDTESALDLFHMQNFDILVLQTAELPCVPRLRFSHGFDPLEPLTLDMARFNNFAPLVLHRCSTKSEVSFQWQICNNIGNKILHEYGETTIALLKVPPYRLWFHYNGEVISSFSLVATLTEKSQQIDTRTQARCFILLLPKPVEAAITGGLHRQVGMNQDLLMDGSASRDYALAASTKQNLFFQWDCSSVDDSKNHFCHSNLSTDNKMEIPKGNLQPNATYEFILKVQSKVFPQSTNLAKQQIVITEKPQLLLDIVCVRNCQRGRFNGDQFIHLMVQRVMGKKRSTFAKISWTINSAAKNLSNDSRCLYTPKEFESSLLFQVEAWDEKGVGGKALKELKLNLPPIQGSCTITPDRGVAFETDFRLKCIDFQDTETPLSYEFMVENFVLERINDAEVTLVLPECTALKILICDQLNACTQIQLSVMVDPLPKPANLSNFSSTYGNYNHFALGMGHTHISLVLIKSLAKYLNSSKDIGQLIQHFGNLELHTLLEMEQWLGICHGITFRLLPLDSQKSLALKEFLGKLSHVLRSISKDQEIQYMSLKSYEQAMAQIWAIAEVLSRTWEIPLSVHKTEYAQMVTSPNPLAESYSDLSDFDIFVLDRIANWVQTTRELSNSLHLLGSQALHKYQPLEPALVIDHDSVKLRIIAFEKSRDHYVDMREQLIDMGICTEVIADLKRQFDIEGHFTVHVGSSKLNHFWWFPDDIPISTNLLHMSFQGQRHLFGQSFRLFHPIEVEFHLNQTQLLHSQMEFGSEIRSPLHMALLSLKLPSNAALVVTLHQAKTTMLIGIGIGHTPRSHQLQKPLNETFRRHAIVNVDTQMKDTFIDLLAANDNVTFPFPYKLSMQIVQCLFWDWNAKDPQWSSDGCVPELDLEAFPLLVKCKCNHLSIYTAKCYPTAITEVLKVRSLLNVLSLNWHAVALFVLTAITLSVTLICNYFRSLKHSALLISDVNSHDEDDIEVCLYTGSAGNSFSTANIQLSFISESGPYSLTIYQHPKKLQLQQNSVCKLYLSSHKVRIPSKLSIENNQVGRYPSWYCHRITVRNLNTNYLQSFPIEQGISLTPIETIFSPIKQSFTEVLRQQLAYLYVNWFQFQPLMGPAIFNDLCRLQRTCVWMSQVMVSLCMVACFYGPTTMHSYEQDRELYYSLQFGVVELVLLPLACNLCSLAVRCLFSTIRIEDDSNY
ncbi:uncharacterized protein LOC106087723 isoform X1 [Stomoxys calcitrans]|uniref:uncharacterized protein LOC106087723 isoform X1 n=1 Tax=Stomoxys calcitrans TaxID=35570 RepID=UPI0027E290D4|nr:uncharacterized protein LOC106087723 isoform X1 [Stomoxys calcitrans]